MEALPIEKIYKLRARYSGGADDRARLDSVARAHYNTPIRASWCEGRRYIALFSAASPAPRRMSLAMALLETGQAVAVSSSGAPAPPPGMEDATVTEVTDTDLIHLFYIAKERAEELERRDARILELRIKDVDTRLEMHSMKTSYNELEARLDQKIKRLEKKNKKKIDAMDAAYGVAMARIRALEAAPRP